jgi:hypothetical protein
MLGNCNEVVIGLQTSGQENKLLKNFIIIIIIIIIIFNCETCFILLVLYDAVNRNKVSIH